MREPPVGRTVVSTRAGTRRGTQREEYRVTVRLEKLTEPHPVPHLFSHSKPESYDTLDKQYRAQEPWFKYTRLNGETHFPGAEPPQDVAAGIEGFLQTKRAKLYSQSALVVSAT
ncbi:hypothetical protein [Streptomyces sp. NPDC004728]|uniref:hypothetical protein n=1 Tax=Streptomyces sp. NPDC004728 TaxID=3154289 RepID=UPI0033BB050A